MMAGKEPLLAASGEALPSIRKVVTKSCAKQLGIYSDVYENADEV